jgi:hypothetical protein
MAAPQKILAGLLIFFGAVILGLWIPLSDMLLSPALEEGGFLATVAFLLLLAATGLGLLLWGLRLLRKREQDI